jgi:Kdo2-lipid IVA lauroyltransferase/acyltransferase
LGRKKSDALLRAEYLVAATLIGSLRWLPLPAANATARGATRVLDLLIPKLRRVARKNLSFALPELGTTEQDRIINGVFRSVARMLVALARFPSIDKANVSQWIAYEGLDNYLAAKKRGRGILVATAHLGNWELSAFAHALMTEPMNVMIRPLDNPLIDGLVERRRVLSGNKLIDKRDAARSVLKALRNNEAVGILIDQNTSESEGVFVPFFNRLASASSGFVKLAHHSGAAVIPGFAFWDAAGGRYTLRFDPAVEMTGDVKTDTARIHAIFEELIRRYPDQWMWIHRRWKTRPPGEPPLY